LTIEFVLLSINLVEEELVLAINLISRRASGIALGLVRRWYKLRLVGFSFL